MSEGRESSRRAVRIEKALWLLLVLGCVFPGYMVIGHLIQDPKDPRVIENTRLICTSLDRAIPFAPIWIWVYAAIYTCSVLPILVVSDRLLFRRIAISYIFILLSSYVVFLAFPVSSVGFRPPVSSLDMRVFWEWGLALNYFVDPPMNCFPSLHLSIAFIAAFSSWKVDRRTGALALALASTIGVSTTFVKQHYLADVVGGILLAAAAYAIFLRGYPMPDPPRQEDVRDARVGFEQYVLVYLAAVLGICGTLFVLGFMPWKKGP